MDGWDEAKTNIMLIKEKINNLGIENIIDRQDALVQLNESKKTLVECLKTSTDAEQKNNLKELSKELKEVQKLLEGKDNPQKKTSTPDQSSKKSIKEGGSDGNTQEKSEDDPTIFVPFMKEKESVTPNDKDRVSDPGPSVPKQESLGLPEVFEDKITYELIEEPVWTPRGSLQNQHTISEQLATSGCNFDKTELKIASLEHDDQLKKLIGEFKGARKRNDEKECNRISDKAELQVIGEEKRRREAKNREDQFRQMLHTMNIAPQGTLTEAQNQLKYEREIVKSKKEQLTSISEKDMEKWFENKNAFLVAAKLGDMMGPDLKTIAEDQQPTEEKLKDLGNKDFQESDYGNSKDLVEVSEKDQIGTKLNGQRCGFGVFTHKSGKQSGQFTNDKRNGWGQESYDSGGGRYIGMFKNDKRHGFGIQIWTSNKQRYIGEWFEGKKHGKCYQEWYNPNWEMTVRQMGDQCQDARSGRGRTNWIADTVSDQHWGWQMNGKMDGFCQQAYKDGANQEGQFKDNNREGQGYQRWKDGAVFEGSWRTGKKHGQGEQLYAHGDIYKGQWANDVRNGQGYYYWAKNGDEYDGEWKDGMRNGRGKYKFGSGKVDDGYFVKNVFQGDDASGLSIQ